MTYLFKLATAILILVPMNFFNSAFAHHAFAAEFDKEKPVHLKGMVTEMKWSNPHAWIYVDDENSNGEVVNWAFETVAANVLFRRGWRPADVPAGTVLEVQGWQARNDSPTASLSAATLPGGQKLFSGTPD